MKAIVDCNNFYCSCERLFKPHLDRKPVVVLSNNDGCIVSRSDEAKKLGVEMAGPYFMAKPLIEKHDVEVFSVDEAFLDLSIFPLEDLPKIAKEIRTTVEDWTGIKVSVGVAPTKVLAKLANRMAKKNKHLTDCITVLDTEEKISAALHKTPVSDIWGVGGQYAKKLKEVWGIYDAWQLRNLSDEFAHTHLGGVVGIRLVS